MSSGPDLLPETGDVVEGFAAQKANEALNKIEKKSPRAHGFIMFALLLIPTIFFANLASEIGGGWIVIALLFAAASFFFSFKDFL